MKADMGRRAAKMVFMLIFVMELLAAKAIGGMVCFWNIMWLCVVCR
jgi:hypothetical protein